MTPGLLPGVVLGFAACFILGVMACLAVVLHWLRPRWEQAAWWKTAPAATREAIGRHARAAAEVPEDQAVTDVLKAVPRIRAHEPPGAISAAGEDGPGWLEHQLASFRAWKQRITREDSQP